jgi:hypothetical protein
MANPMSGPHYINENQSDIRGIKPGWYASDSDGNLSLGPFSSREECDGRGAQPMKGLVPPQSGLKAKPATPESDRLTEDEIAREKLGPRGVPGALDTAKMTTREEKIFPGAANSTVIPPDSVLRQLLH